MADRWITRQLVIDALSMAIKNGGLKSGLIHHSDQVVQHASNELRALLKTYNLLIEEIPVIESAKMDA